MTRPAWIAADWGTTNLRVFAMGASGEVLAEARNDHGMGTLAPGPARFEPALLELIGPWLEKGTRTRVLACGMVGSRQGWSEASYLKVPVNPTTREGLTRAQSHDPRIEVFITSGVSQTNPPDVMRGEETQVAGLLSISPSFQGVVAMPGTHSKWVQVVDGEIFHFASFMTGELFALMATQSILRHSIDLKGFDEAAFGKAFDESLARPERIAGRLFSLRAGHLLHGADPIITGSQLSGYLTGLEFGGAKPYWLGQEVALVAAGQHEVRMRIGLDRIGASYSVFDPDKCVLAGLAAAQATLSEPEISA